jgi:hypothetical protein
MPSTAKLRCRAAQRSCSCVKESSKACLSSCAGIIRAVDVFLGSVFARVAGVDIIVVGVLTTFLMHDGFIWQVWMGCEM